MTTRDIRLDSLRGILLVIMTFNHLSGGISELTSEPFGFVSAAEGFVLLSAYTSAVTSRKGAVPLQAMVGTGLRRAWRIYKYHAALLLMLAALVLAVPAYGEYWRGHFYTSDGSLLHSVEAGLLLAHQPTYFDILPMYVLFSLLTPFLLRVLRSGHLAALLLASGGLWLFGQTVHPVPDLESTVGWQAKAGLFNLLSWQGLWVVGLTIGFAHAHLGNNPVLRRTGAVAAAGVIVLLCFLLRHDLLPVSETLLVHFDKPELGILRVLNIAAQLVLALYSLALLRRDAELPFFHFIGRYSLQVFTYHVFVVYALLPFGWRVTALGLVPEAVFHVLIVASLALPALLYRRYRAIVRTPPVLAKAALPR
jgi:hypothetical protein